MSSSFEYHNLTITWLHHASFLVQGGGENLYIDPFKIGEDLKGSVRNAPDLVSPPADYILVSHDHFDHFDQASIEALSSPSTKVVASFAVKKTSLVDVTLEPGIPAKFGDWMVHCVPAYNIGKSFHQKESGGCGFFIEYAGSSGNVTVYHAGDTDWIPEMSELRGRVRVALLPIGGTYTMNVDDAVKAVATIAPEAVIPMHYNLLDETSVSEDELRRFVNEAGKLCKQVIVLEPKY